MYNLKEHQKRIAVILIDLLLIIFAYYFSFMIRFEMDIPDKYLWTMIKILPFIIIIRIMCSWFFGLYKGIWRFASMDDLWSIIKAISRGF